MGHRLSLEELVQKKVNSDLKRTWPSQNQTCPQVVIEKSDPKLCLSGPLAHAEKNGKVEIELALKSSA